MIAPLTSIRLIFILMIFLFHCHVPYSGNMGCYGVSFFFILSGFVLSLSYKQKVLSGDFSQKRFYKKRFLRIYPLHILILALYIVLSIIFQEPITNFFNWIAKLIINILLLQSYIPISTVYFSFSGAWFLSTLVLSYFLFPYCIKVIQKFSIKCFLFLLLIPMGMLFYKGGNEIYWFYINPVVRFFFFFFGILLVEVYREIKMMEDLTSKSATFLEFLVILFSVILYYVSLKYEIGVFNYSVFYWIQSSCLILILAINKGLISKLLCNKWLVYGGKLSFSFFLFHPLLIHFMGLEGHYNIILIAIVSIFLSHLTVKYFDPLWTNNKKWNKNHE